MINIINDININVCVCINIINNIINIINININVYYY